MFTHSYSKIFVVLLVLAIAFVTASFVTHSANIPAADRSYDGLEQVRVLRPAASSYDSIEQVRIERSASSLLTNSGYDLIEQVRNGRTLNADHSYDKIEALRIQR